MSPLAGQVRDHLVRVHVRGGSGACLEDIDRELVVVAAGGDAVGRLGDGVGELAVEQSKLSVDPGGGRLDPGQPVDYRKRDAFAGDGEVRTALLVSAPQSCCDGCSRTA